MDYALTPIEQAFLDACSGRLSGMESQYWIENYRVDFAIPTKRLAIELDGHEFHSSREDRTRDASRQRELQRLGWTVIRFTGTEIYRNVASCVREIESHLSTRPDVEPPAQEPSAGPFYCVRMQEVVTHLLDKHGRSLSSEELYVHFPGRSCYQPLTIEKHGSSISIAHFYLQNEDIVYDPRVDFAATSNGSDYICWIPLGIQQTMFGYRACAELLDDGTVVVFDPETQLDIANLTEHWARNIRGNGWFDEDVCPNPI